MKEESELFTQEYNPGAVKKARKACAECPVAAMCLADALADKESMGVRAGFVFIMGGLREESREMIKKLYNLNARKVPASH